MTYVFISCVFQEEKVPSQVEEELSLTEEVKRYVSVKGLLRQCISTQNVVSAFIFVLIILVH